MLWLLGLITEEMEADGKQWMQPRCVLAYHSERRNHKQNVERQKCCAPSQALQKQRANSVDAATAATIQRATTTLSLAISSQPPRQVFTKGKEDDSNTQETRQ